LEVKMTNQLKLTGIHVYPVKSLSGHDLNHTVVDGFGLAHDRRWMVVDRDGRFLTQRERPRMALIQVTLEASEIGLTAPDMPPLRISTACDGGPRVEVVVWQDRCEATAAGQDADIWLSQFLGIECHLVYMSDDVRRQVDQRYAEPQHYTSFSDGFPLLLISEASLNDLNSRLEQPLSMRRFRPNLVVSGCAPYAEDQWSRIRIGAMELRLVKPCSRCKITTIDPDTGTAGSEPLKTLAGYRRVGNMILFGQNLVYDRPGELKTGMPVEILV
jgi:uncharacterized protein YcbX